MLPLVAVSSIHGFNFITRFEWLHERLHAVALSNQVIYISVPIMFLYGAESFIISVAKAKQLRAATGACLPLSEIFFHTEQILDVRSTIRSHFFFML